MLTSGASSGIGAATARPAAARGARVALVARRRDRLNALADEIGGNALALPADLTDAESARAVVDDAVAAFGGLDIVVNNAGVLLTGPVEDSSTDDFDHMLAVNLHAFLYVARAALPHLLDSAAQTEERVSDLVNISSASGRRSVPGSAVYNLTKWGVGGFSDSLRQEVAERDVRVGLVEPGGTDTDLALSDAPTTRPVNPAFAGYQRLRAEDIAETIVWMVTRPRGVAVNELLVRPTHQAV